MRADLAGLTRLRRVFRVAALSLTLALLGLLAMQAAGASTVAAPAVSGSANASGAFHQTKTIKRVNLINGQNVVVDRRTVSLSVNVTSNLVERQVINVSWSGAHPTGGIISDPNDGANAQLDEEYPMVLLECHGKPSQIRPQDCWTSTPSERYFTAGLDTPFPPWRLDRYATAAGQRDLIVHQPNPLPTSCGLIPSVRYWLHYVTPTGKSYPIGQGGCAGMPNEMNLTGGLGILPSEETFAATHLDGRGSAAFDVWTNEIDPDLGCSQHVSCALVAVPIMGIGCDPAAQSMPPADQPTPAQEPAAAALCEQTGYWPPGSIDGTGQTGDLTVSGALWWAASNWRDRFVVPLHFAPPGGICAIVNKHNHFIQAYGSELLDQAAQQWQPHFCLNSKLFTLGYVSTSEPAAATQLQAGTIEAALVSNQPPPGYFPKPVVHAPVALTGFAISFVIDNSNGVPVTTLRLDPRLLAKLLTESYPGVLAVAQTDPEILHPCPGVPVPGSTMCTNPLDIASDPEFQALNPGIPRSVGASAAASTLLALSTNSDVMRALTSYINDNQAARAWLNGTPDPWGMTVNSKYLGIALPVSNWPMRSTFEPLDWLPGGRGTGPGGPDGCYVRNPSPVLPLIASPVPDLPDLALDIQFYLSQSQLQCTGDPDVPASYHLAALGAQTVGFRFMIGVTTLGDARRFALNTASLLTYTKPGTPAKFTSGAGMTFTPPTDAALRDAASLLAPDTTQYDWSLPYSLYQKDSVKAAHAYPGTMLVYADVPTSGLPALDAADYATFLRFAATTGQAPGGAIGQLASGYLPMTAANHLGAEANYTMAAAAAIAAQKGVIPPLLAKYHGSGSPSPTSSPSGSSPSVGSGPGGGGTPSGGGTPTPSASGSGAATAYTPAANFGIISYVLPAVAGLALAAAAGALLTSRLARSRPNRLAWLRGNRLARLRGKRWG